MNTVIGFDNGICGILRMKLSSAHKVLEFPENLALGKISCCDNAAGRLDARQILLFDNPDSIKS